MNDSAATISDQAEYQGLFFDHLVRQQFTWFSNQNLVALSALENKLAERLDVAMEQVRDNPKRLLFIRLTFGEQLPAMLDLILDQADTDDAMRRTINQESWLAKELLQWVNAPRFRQTTATHSDYVGSLDQALEKFDGKMLAKYMLDFAMVQAAGREGQFCQLMNRRILEWSQEMGFFAKALAEVRDLCVPTATMSALVQGIAPLAVTQSFVHLFEAQIKGALEKARAGGQKQVYDQIKGIRPPVQVLSAHLARSSVLQPSLLSELGATGQLLASLTKEANADLPAEQLSEQAKILRQARGYCQYRWLNDACVLTPNQSHSLLASLSLSESDMAMLAAIRRR